ncbi:MAG: hypothetical protein A3I66_15050 [Burkholderiales bacterium RIFCSPLOWO2_02_FULL_57_36]|nr:MAG: hypothetical protein A3I66_15050 [Burkholderiales bacterium RIFCSPLOWO2_02_FULL_57_36]
MRYLHLTRDKRYQIHILKRAGHNQSKITDLMKRDKSTIGRELKRNCGERDYRPKHSHELSLARMRAKDNGRRVSAETCAVAV